MTDKLLEQVSALADDELDPREARMLLARMERDSELRDNWERYHLVGEAMRGALANVHKKDFAASVSAHIGNDARPDARGFAVGRMLVKLRPVAGLAVAASVAMLAVFTLQGPQFAGPSEVVPRAGNVASNVPMMDAQRVDFSGVRSPEVQNQLRSYLLNHSEHAGGSRLRGVMPYVQIAAHDTRPVETAAEDPDAERVPEPRN